MKFISKCLPFGALPYDSIESTTRMMAKLYEKNPFLCFLPKISPDDNIINRTFTGIPGIKIKNNKVVINTGTNAYKLGMTKLDKAYNSADSKLLEAYAFDSPFLKKFISIIKKFKSHYAYVNLLGPFSISQMLNEAAEQQMLEDKTYRKMFVQAVCVKALWIIQKIKEVSPETVPVIILEEPLLAQFGTLKRENENITHDIVVNLLSKVIEKIKSTGALVAVQSFEKCDWKIPINAGADIISFDAYNNPNNLCIMPTVITDFIARGGNINWAIIPVISESIVKSLNAEYVLNRLTATMDGLILAGVPEKFVYNSALVSIQGDVDKLPVIFAEKTHILTSQLAKKIPVKK